MTARRCNVINGVVLRPKVCYQTKSDAVRGAKYMRKKIDRKLRPYWCDVHAAWHLTTKKEQ